MKRVLAIVLLGLLLALGAQPTSAATSFTSCLTLPKPQVGDAGWGNTLNTATTLTDSAIAGIVSLGVGGNTDVILTSVTGGPDQARNAHFVLTGNLTGNIKVFWPQGLCRIFSVKNATAGAFSLTLAVNNGAGSPAGTTLAVPQGSSVEAVADGTNVAVRTTPIANGVATDWGSHGQVRLALLSSTQVNLSPYNGNHLYVPGTGVMAIPSSGVTLSNAATLTEGGAPLLSTLYYVYAYSNVGNLALQMSATTHATDAATGVEIRSGDATRVLVGMVRTNASVQFVDTSGQRWVASWFNRRSRSLAIGVTVPGYSTSNAAIEVGGARMDFVTWGDETSFVTYSAGMSVAVADTTACIQAGLDGVGGTPGFSCAGLNPANIDHAASNSGAVAPSEGRHFFAAIGLTTTNRSVTYSIVGAATVRQ